MGPGPGLVAHVLWRHCMRLASSGVGGVRRVRLRLALLYVGSCVGVLWMMFWMRLASSGVWGGVHRASGAVRIVRWPTSGAPLAARSAVLVGAGRVEVGGPWPHSPLADERLPLGSQSLSVVAALRSACGLLRRGSGQLKVGLLGLGLAREQQCNAPVRIG